MAILSFYKTAFISANNPIGERNYSWLKIFNVPIHEIFRSLTKVAWKREKSVHFEVIVILVANWAFFSLQNFVYFLKKLFWQPICSSLNVFEIRSHQGFPKLHNNCIKDSKFEFFCVFFKQNLMHFFNTNCFYLFKETTTTTYLFPTERL